MELTIPDHSHIKVTLTEKAIQATIEWNKACRVSLNAERPKLKIMSIHPAWQYEEYIVEVYMGTEEEDAK